MLINSLLKDVHDVALILCTNHFISFIKTCTYKLCMIVGFDTLQNLPDTASPKFNLGELIV